MSKIGEQIKKRRLEIGMTLAEEAELLGVAEATAQRYESGKIKTLKYDTICNLASVLKCSPSYLMGWQDVIYDNEPMLDDAAKSLVDEYERRPELRKLIDLARSADKDTLLLAIQMLERMIK